MLKASKPSEHHLDLIGLKTCWVSKLPKREVGSRKPTGHRPTPPERFRRVPMAKSL